MNQLDLQALTGAKRARVEIIPLIDVVFFLLATFVLFTLALSKIGLIDAELPQPSPTFSDIDETVYIQASLAGTFYWKQGRSGSPELVNTAQLEPRLNEYRSRIREPRVLIRGDDKATYGSAVEVLDSARKAGIRRVSVETVVGATGN